MIAKLYRKYIPSIYREKIYQAFLGDVLSFLRTFPLVTRSKLTYLCRQILPATEKNAAYAFIGKHGLTCYPFEASLLYKDREVDVFHDKNSGLPYVLHNRKKLFFPLKYAAENVRETYRSLLLEQDLTSPHRYVEDYTELKGRVLLDLGAAEGIFSLETIDLTKKVYLFECEDHWIEALEATFSPWKDKVCILKGYIGNSDVANTLSLDSIFSNQEDVPLFIKMDIEGAEQDALHGSRNLLNRLSDVHLAVCTYHKEEDAEVIPSLLSEWGYEVSFTEGYLCFVHRYLRKCLVRAKSSGAVI